MSFPVFGWLALVVVMVVVVVLEYRRMRQQNPGTGPSQPGGYGTNPWERGGPPSPTPERPLSPAPERHWVETNWIKAGFGWGIGFWLAGLLIAAIPWVMLFVVVWRAIVVVQAGKPNLAGFLGLY